MSWWQTLFGRRRPETPQRQAAQALIRAIDAGGVPLHPARVNQIARGLGLRVSVHDPVERTVVRIRRALR